MRAMDRTQQPRKASASAPARHRQPTFFRYVNRSQPATDLGDEFCRVLVKRGWKPARNPESARLVWSSRSNDAAQCYPDQIANHFRGHGAITTKVGLAAQFTSRQVWSTDVDPETLMPRSYVLKTKDQLEAFRNDFVETAVIGIISCVVNGNVPRDPKRISLLRTLVDACERRWGCVQQMGGWEDSRIRRDYHNGHYHTNTTRMPQKGGHVQADEIHTISRCDADNNVHGSAAGTLTKGRETTTDSLEHTQHNKERNQSVDDVISLGEILGKVIQEKALLWSYGLAAIQRTPSSRSRSEKPRRRVRKRNCKHNQTRVMGSRRMTCHPVQASNDNTSRVGQTSVRQDNTAITQSVGGVHRMIKQQHDTLLDSPERVGDNATECAERDQTLAHVQGSWNNLRRRGERIVARWKANDVQFVLNGDRGIWVVKAAAASKGVGVSLHHRWEDIVRVASGNESRVVQKYIERPLLYKGFKVSLRSEF
jgi:hypothetical protein